MNTLWKVTGAKFSRQDRYELPPDVSGVGLAIQPDIPLRRAETQGGLQVPAKGVDEADGRDREQVGKEAIMGK